ncbi:SDR family NAD(P)-dependent oxidoreductase [Rhodalgimonas zhirmunskyi]|uniref:SDR family oxidoreductase n=1 Tax=Rhodalgimonas zhirmunskyi TaxID=2964767 RepID=A0AAJ1UB36_9RHOB|nr:SDR family oxidoreductase [Rhodoalgimonas zhirmunskyi]MDQ2092607.1 SDR family oxidoreductase [Rhodoalgimonas zhirmunskyi]
MEKKIALITGASRGLGAGLAEALADTHHIVAVARTTGALEELDDRIQAKGGSATLAPMDVSNPDAMAQLCRGIHDRWGAVDLWAHTAIHTVPLSPVPHIDAKAWEKSVAVNTTATGTLIAYVTPLLGDDGRALFFDDPAPLGAKFHGAYGATKAAQIALARSWAAENTKSGPRVHILTPEPMATSHRGKFHPGENRAALAHPADEARRLLASIGEIA